MLTYHPNTGAATPHRSGDRSVVLNVEPPPAPGLLGSSSSCLIPLLYTDHIFSALLGLCHWHFPSRCLLDHSSPQWHNLKLVFCQSFWWWKGKALPLKLNRATVCCLRVGRCIIWLPQTGGPVRQSLPALTCENEFTMKLPVCNPFMQVNSQDSVIFNVPKIFSKMYASV